VKATVELSLYPLQEDYTETIILFIKALKSYTDIQVHTTAMSTYLTGDYDAVMQALTTELKVIHQRIPDSSTVIKIIPKQLNIEGGYLTF